MKINLGCGSINIGSYLILSMIEKICKECGKNFKVYPSRKDTAKYCSNDCYNKNKSGVQNPMYGKKHSKESINKIKNHPNRCKFPKGSENPTYKHWILSPEKMEKRFLELYEKGLNDTEIAKELSLGINTIKHWRYKLGLPSNYRLRTPIGSATIRKRMLEKIDRCMICGFLEEKKILQLHHKDRNRRNNKEENLLLICPNCHELIHYRKRTGKYDKKARS